MAGAQRDFAVGMGLALRGKIEHWQHRVALLVYSDGVSCEVSAADEVAARFRLSPWVTTPVAPQLDVVGLLQLFDKAVGDRVAVRGVITAIEDDVAYERKGDGATGLKRSCTLSDASQRSVLITVFLQPDQPLELVVGKVVVVQGVLEILRSRIALRAFPDGVGGDETSHHALQLMARWSPAWQTTPLVPRWNFASFDTLADKPDNARVDLLGTIVDLGAPQQYIRKSDTTSRFRCNIELCDESERCVRLTVFLDDEAPLPFAVGAAVGVRGARVSSWQGMVSVSAPSSAMTPDPLGSSSDASSAQAGSCSGGVHASDATHPQACLGGGSSFDPSEGVEAATGSSVRTAEQSDNRAAHAEMRQDRVVRATAPASLLTHRTTNAFHFHPLTHASPFSTATIAAAFSTAISPSSVSTATIPASSIAAR